MDDYSDAKNTMEQCSIKEETMDDCSDSKDTMELCGIKEESLIKGEI